MCSPLIVTLLYVKFVILTLDYNLFMIDLNYHIGRTCLHRKLNDEVFAGIWYGGGP